MNTSSYFCRCLLLGVFVSISFIITPVMAADVIRQTIIDNTGRKVSVPTSVKRIVALGGALRFVTYLQGLDLVVGVEALEKKPLAPGRLYGLVAAEKVQQLPVIGEGGPGGKLPDFEQIISVHPDLILGVGLDKTSADTIQEKTTIPVLLLSSGAMASLDLNTTKEALTLLGSVIDRAKRAKTLSNYISELTTDLARRTSSQETRPTTYVGGVGFRGKHGITSTEVHYAPLSWVNGNNVTDAINHPGHIFIDQEKLLYWDPEVIFIDAIGMDMVKEGYRKNPSFYNALKAVGSGRVFMVPPYNSYHTNIETALANAYFMGKVLYPAAFADIEPVEQADAIFNFFIGVKAVNHLLTTGYGYGQAVFDKGVIVIR